MDHAAATKRLTLVLQVPLARELQINLIGGADAAAGVRMPVAAVAGNGASGTHSAAIAALVEVAAYTCLVSELAETEHAVTHSLSLNLLAPAPAGAELRALGVLDRRTRRVAFSMVRVECGGDLVARAQVVKSVVPFTPG